MNPVSSLRAPERRSGRRAERTAGRPDPGTTADAGGADIQARAYGFQPPPRRARRPANRPGEYTRENACDKTAKPALVYPAFFTPLVRELHPATGAPQGPFMPPPWRDPHPDPPPAREREKWRRAAPTYSPPPWTGGRSGGGWIAQSRNAAHSSDSPLDRSSTGTRNARQRPGRKLGKRPGRFESRRGRIMFPGIRRRTGGAVPGAGAIDRTRDTGA